MIYNHEAKPSSIFLYGYAVHTFLAHEVLVYPALLCTWYLCDSSRETVLNPRNRNDPTRGGGGGCSCQSVSTTEG